jgi:hypothetical protein
LGRKRIFSKKKFGENPNVFIRHLHSSGHVVPLGAVGDATREGVAARVAAVHERVVAGGRSYESGVDVMITICGDFRQCGKKFGVFLKKPML